MVPLTDAEIEVFLGRALSKAGSAEMVTPREIIRDYLTLLNILRDNAGATFEDLMSNITFRPAEDADEEPARPAEGKSLLLEVGAPTIGEGANMKPKNKVSLLDIDI